MSAVGFEPTRSKTLRPERNPLDHSGKLTRTNYKNNNTSTNARNIIRTNTRNTTNTTKYTRTTPRTHNTHSYKNTHNPHHKRRHPRTTLKHTPTHIQTRALLARRMPPPSDSQMLRVKQEKGHNTQHTTHNTQKNSAAEKLQRSSFKASTLDCRDDTDSTNNCNCMRGREGSVGERETESSSTDRRGCG